MDNHLTLTSVVFESEETAVDQCIQNDLTLTSVVFECVSLWDRNENKKNLTLTSVVFESATKSTLFTVTPVFNFNKCCI